MVSSRVDSYSKKEVAAPTCSGEEGAGIQVAQGQTIQPLQTYEGSLREKYGGSKQLTSQHDWSNRLR
jgi:hypothetical protein